MKFYCQNHPNFEGVIFKDYLVDLDENNNRDFCIMAEDLANSWFNNGNFENETELNYYFFKEDGFLFKHIRVDIDWDPSFYAYEEK